MPRTTSNWEQLTRNMLLDRMRLQNQKMLEEDLNISKVQVKRPAANLAQLQCGHLETVIRANQWSRIVECKHCQYRLAYQPTALAIEAALARKSRPSRQARRSMTRPEARQRVAGTSGAESASGSAAPSPEMARIEQLLVMSAEASMNTQNLVERLAVHTASLTQHLETMVNAPTSMQEDDETTSWQELSTGAAGSQ